MILYEETLKQKKVIFILEFSKCFLFLWVSKTSSNTGIFEVQ